MKLALIASVLLFFIFPTYALIPADNITDNQSYVTEPNTNTSFDPENYEVFEPEETTVPIPILTSQSTSSSGSGSSDDYCNQEWYNSNCTRKIIPTVTPTITAKNEQIPLVNLSDNKNLPIPTVNLNDDENASFITKQSSSFTILISITIILIIVFYKKK